MNHAAVYPKQRHWKWTVSTTQEKINFQKKPNVKSIPLRPGILGLLSHPRNLSTLGTQAQTELNWRNGRMYRKHALLGSRVPGPQGMGPHSPLQAGCPTAQPSLVGPSKKWTLQAESSEQTPGLQSLRGGFPPQPPTSTSSHPTTTASPGLPSLLTCADNRED